MKTLAILLTIMMSCGALPPKIKDTPYSAPEGYVEETADRISEQAGLEPIVEETIPEDSYVEEITDRIGEETGLEPIVEETIPEDSYVEETTDRVDEQTGLEPIIEETIPEGIIDDGFIAETTDRIGCTIEPVTDNSTLLPVIAINMPEERTGLEPIIEEEIPDDAFVEETEDFF